MPDNVLEDVTEQLAGIPRISGEAATPAAWSRPTAPFRLIPHAGFLERPASQERVGNADVARAWAGVVAAGERVEAAIDRLRALDGERAAVITKARADADAAVTAGREPKPAKAGTDWPVEQASRESAWSATYAALRASREAYDRCWEQERPDVRRERVAAVPDAVTSARMAFAPTATTIRETLGVLSDAAALVAEDSDREAHAVLAREQQADLNRLASALAVVESVLGSGLGSWLSDATPVYPTLKQREQMMRSENGNYALAEVESREQFRVTAHTIEFAETLLAGRR